MQPEQCGHGEEKRRTDAELKLPVGVRFDSNLGCFRDASFLPFFINVVYQHHGFL